MTIRPPAVYCRKEDSRAHNQFGQTSERCHLRELRDRSPQENHDVEDEQIARVAQQRLMTPDSRGNARDIKRCDRGPAQRNRF